MFRASTIPRATTEKIQTTTLFRSCLLVLLLAFSFQSQGSTVLVLGDSLSAGYGIDVSKGWVNLIQNRFADTHRIVNGSISGETTGGGLARLPALLKTHQPSYVIIELGGNDGLQGHPLSHVKNNLLRLIELCEAAGAQPILFGMEIPANYGKRYGDQFASLYPKVARQKGTPLFPFAFDDLLRKQGMMQKDGIHPTEKAQPIIAERLGDFLGPILNNSQ